MANHKSAEKRARQSVKLQKTNRARKSRVSGAVRKVEEAITTKQYDAAMTALRTAQPELARAAGKKSVSKKRTSRKLSRLSARIKKLKQA